ncbi:MAG: hypothetical protein WCJ37_12205 [Syntrophus sp. (in: bacteria)]
MNQMIAENCSIVSKKEFLAEVGRDEQQAGFSPSIILPASMDRKNIVKTFFLQCFGNDQKPWNSDLNGGKDMRDGHGFQNQAKELIN